MVCGAWGNITVTFIMFAALRRAYDKITVTFIVFAELGTVTQITSLTDYGSESRILFHESFSNL